MNHPEEHIRDVQDIRSALGSLSPPQLQILVHEIGDRLTRAGSAGQLAAELAALVDAVPMLIWIAHDRDCTRITTNKAAAAFLRQPSAAEGVREGAAHYRVFRDAREIEPHDYAMHAAARGTPVRDWEVAVQFDNGDRRILFGNAEPLLDADGAPCGAVGAFLDITERRLAEEHLRRSEAEFRAMFELANVGNLQTEDGRIVRANRKFAEMLGYTDPAELVGKALADLTHPDERAASAAFMERKRAGDIVEYQIEKRYLSKNGVPVWVLIYGKVLSRQPLRSIATTQDISERRRIEHEREAALQQAEALTNELKLRLAETEARQRVLDALLEQIPTGITIVDVDQPEWRLMSRYGRELIGLPPHIGARVPVELLIERWRWLNPGDLSVLPLQERPLRRALGRGQTLRDQEFILERSDGRQFAVLCNATPIRDADGHVQGAIATWHDITERNRTETALRESEETLRRAQAVANIGSFDYDLANGRVRWSPQLYTIFGVDPRTFVPRLGDTLQFVPEDERAKVQRALETAITQHSPYRVEHRIRRRDGSERIVLTQGEITSWDPSGRPLRIVGTSLDLTERRRTEEELRKRQQLESLGVLAGGIAHDFNNILTVIFGNIALAQLKTPPDSPAIEPLKEAEAGFKRAIDLTRQLLTFSKGGAPIRKTASLADLVADTARFVLRGSSVRVDLQIAPDLWPSHIDEGQISQAINNLVINAKEAMPQGGHLQIEARNVVLHAGNEFSIKPGRYVMLRIKDTGHGIPAHQKDNVFDPYYTTKPGGTGLGLTTTYSIIKRHDGHLTFNSRPGKGTTFYVYLPASEEAVPATDPPSVKPISHERGRVLLMDDDPAVRQVGERLLAQLGYSIALARNGEEALQLFGDAHARGEQFAAVILDLTVVGGMGGKDCLKHLRTLDPNANVLVSTGYSNDPVVAHFRQNGFQGVVPKPYQLEDLARALAPERTA